MAEGGEEIGQLSRLELLRHLEDYLNEGDSLGILVAGKMGVGKSSLINSIYSAEIAKEGSSAESVTKEIINFTANVPTPYMSNVERESTLTVWDSPGFGDVFASDEAKLIEELAFVVDKAHIILYCFDIRGRLGKDDAEGLIEITKKVHPDIWKNAVFALTFSNECKPPPNCSESPYKFFLDTCITWRRAIVKVFLDKTEVPHDVVNNLSIIPVGYRNVCPPGCKDWYTPLWTAIYEKMREDGQSVFVKLTYHQLQDNMMCKPDESEIESSSLCMPKVFLYDDVPVCSPDLTTGKPSPNLSSNCDPSTSPSSDPCLLPAAVQPPPPGAPPLEDISLSAGQGYLQEPPTEDEGPPPEDEGPPPEDEGPPPATMNRDTKETSPNKKTFVKGAAGIAGCAVAGAIVGTLVGIIGGPIGMAAGAAGGTAIGACTGVAAIIARKIAKYINKKRKQKKEGSMVP